MANDLEKKIVQQIEYYFGDINLPRDKFMQEKIGEDDGWIAVDVLLTFRRLANLSTDAELIANAIEKSESPLVKVSEDKKKLRRNPDIPLPELNEERRKELSLRTAYAKGFPLDEKLDNIVSFLEPYGPIESCLRRTLLDKATKQHVFKGSCFIIFKDVETCKKFIEAESIKYNETELIRKWKKDYLEEKKQDFQERKNKKEKKEKKENPPEEKKFEFPRGAILHFTCSKEGSEEQNIVREEIKEEIKKIGDIEASFIDYSKGDVEGYVRLPTENAAVEFMKKLPENAEITIGETKLKLRALEGEEEEEFLKKTTDSLNKRRQNMKAKGKKRRGNFADNGPRNKQRNRK